jgi:hypothetical protein
MIPVSVAAGENGSWTRLANRRNDSAAAEQFVASIEHNTLAGRHRSLWCSELDRRLAMRPVAFDNRGNIVSLVANPNFGFEWLG